MRSVTLDAPAKINLYLDVLSKRKDGYHNIATIFQKIELSDTVRVSIIKKGISVTCNHPHAPEGRTNLAYKAASLMLKEFKINTGLSISIKKKIPVAAGLGGGSSDAASVILAIDKLFKLKLKRPRLIRLAKEIGADVPFFVSGYNCAIGRGIGERLRELKHPYIMYILLIIPRIKIYTKTIYSKIRLPLTKHTSSANMIARILSGRKGTRKLAGSLYNRLEDIVLPLYPLARKVRDELSFYTDGVLLSGSGPSIFGVFNSRKEAMAARKSVKRGPKRQLFLTRTI